MGRKKREGNEMKRKVWKEREESETTDERERRNRKRREEGKEEEEEEEEVKDRSHVVVRVYSYALHIELINLTSKTVWIKMFSISSSTTGPKKGTNANEHGKSSYT
jgi:uncharacterized membrane protein YdbT with pleckstrin-like domain